MTASTAGVCEGRGRPSSRWSPGSGPVEAPGIAAQWGTRQSVHRFLKVTVSSEAVTSAHFSLTSAGYGHLFKGVGEEGAGMRGEQP